MIFQKIDQQQQNIERDLRHKRRIAQLEANRIGRQLAEVGEQHRREQLEHWEPGNDVLPAEEQYFIDKDAPRYDMMGRQKLKKDRAKQGRIERAIIRTCQEDQQGFKQGGREEGLLF
uniref:Uncharacterized protein n=1 Tax=Caenorhabditis japonica TaxID=281687 RepID=A0A8R1IGE7_CAEJA